MNSSPSNELSRTSFSPLVLHDDAFIDHLTRVITDIRLMDRIGDVVPGRVEVREVHDRREIEVPFEVTGVVRELHRQQLWNIAETLHRVAKGLFPFIGDVLRPTTDDDLSKHEIILPT